MSADTGLDLVTGAFSYSGSRIAERLLDSGRGAGLLVSHDPPLGRIAFSEWLDENSRSIGRSYANELQRHFAIPAYAR